MFPEDIVDLATRVLAAARARGATIATAESCTGGLLAAALTDIAGSSDVFDRGFVTYANGAKEALVDVPASLLATHGAVSEPVVRAMADGALARSDVDFAVAITGVAGPGGGSPDKPVGLVWFALATRGGRIETREARFGEVGRGEVRLASVRMALQMLAAGASTGTTGGGAP